MTYVRLDGAMADDLSVVNAARVSFGKRNVELDESDVLLINFLMRERHGTPFEHNSFRFHIRCPIFVAREWFRHRIGSFNEFSARYSEVPEDFWIPAKEEVRTQIGKPGSYTFTPVEETVAEEAIYAIQDSYQQSYSAYRSMIDSGVAKEVARTVLPMGTFTEFYWTVNARSLMNFLSLRTASTAQSEIRDYAFKVENAFEEHMPVTYEAWNRLGRFSV
jgi:thymidylate synthase (FAD)